jgi:hypothetical protein
MLNAPLRRMQLGLNVLNALKGLGPTLHTNVAVMWDNAIPKLIAYLEGEVTNPSFKIKDRIRSS